ncbi:class I SAM-dependent methyltransferase [Solicola sp. PLA-1-18]|uniref:class I SAM-dependent methyltransferase n=1 Tax=Solicola sp. PLA-1-18 TaxID=3380532 RepID=UPI003B80B58F
MSRPRPLRGVSETLLWTLYLRAVDARSSRPVLGDPWAQQVLDRVEVDARRLALLRGDIRTIATRGRELDRWTQQFLDRHPDGQVVNLACGLDSRVLRVRRPATSAWTDVDLPDVVELRRPVYDLPDDVVTLAASATDPALWRDLPDDRPTLVVAEGLLMYLEPDAVETLLDHLAARRSPGEICFDAVGRWVLPVSRLLKVVARDDVRFRWSTRGARSLARQHPGLVALEDVPMTPLVAREAVPGPVGHLLAASTTLSPLASAMRLLRLGFGHPTRTGI